MAKMALIERELKRDKLAAKYAKKYAELKAISTDAKRTDDERAAARLERGGLGGVDEQRPDEEELRAGHLRGFLGGDDRTFDTGKDHGRAEWTDKWKLRS